MSDEHSTYDFDRPRGILTPEDRKYLMGHKDYANAQSARRRRSKIRERVRNAFFDFVILKYMEGRDRDQVFDVDSEDERTEFGSGFSSGFLFLYDALVRAREDYDHVDLNLYFYLQQAIEHVDLQEGFRSELTMDIEREELDDPVEIFQRAKEDGFEALNGAEIQILWESEEVDRAAFASFMNELFPDEAESIKPKDIKREREGRLEWEQHLDEVR